MLMAMCKGIPVDLALDMRTGMRTDTCMDMCMGMRVDTGKEVQVYEILYRRCQARRRDYKGFINLDVRPELCRRLLATWRQHYLGPTLLRAMFGPNCAGAFSLLGANTT